MVLHFYNVDVIITPRNQSTKKKKKKIITPQLTWGQPHEILLPPPFWSQNSNIKSKKRKQKDWFADAAVWLSGARSLCQVWRISKRKNEWMEISPLSLKNLCHHLKRRLCSDSKFLYTLDL